MADSTISIGQTVTGSGDPVDTYSFNVGANKKLVLELLGPTSVHAGVWLGTAAVPPYGVLRVCGSGVRGVHLFKKAGPCVIQVTNEDGGPYSLKLRPWNLLDYATISFYKSTC
jgi:hypothetical protein